MTKVTGGMKVVSAESIDYGILCDDKAIIQSSNNPKATFLPRNCIAFDGTRVSVTDLRALTFRPLVKIIIIPYSLRAISNLNGTDALSSYSRPTKLEYLDFEFGSDLQSICDFAFAKSPLKSLFSRLQSILLVKAPFLIASLSNVFILSVSLPSAN
jgi:hypothetical protein